MLHFETNLFLRTAAAGHNRGGRTGHNDTGMISIGQRIKDELDRQERTISWLARNINRDRTVVYRIIRSNSIDTAMLASISRILHHDFFADLSADIGMPDRDTNATDV